MRHEISKFPSRGSDRVTCRDLRGIAMGKPNGYFNSKPRKLRVHRPAPGPPVNLEPASTMSDKTRTTRLPSDPKPVAPVELTPEQIVVIDAFNRNEDVDVPAHEAATIFPAMRESEFNELVADIKARGLEQAIILHQNGTILDGVNRFKACREAGCRPKFEAWHGKLGEEIPYVISANLHRRHLNDNQRAAIGADFCNLKQGRPKQANSPVITQKEVAARLNVPDRSIRTARRVVKEAPSNVAALLKQGKISLSAGEAAAKLSDEEKTRFASMTEEEALPATNSLTRKRDAASAKTRTRVEALIGTARGFGVLLMKANDHDRAALRQWIQEEANAAVLDALKALVAPERLERGEG